MLSQLHTPRGLPEFCSNAEFPLIVILGQTASGKTMYSIELTHAMRCLGRSCEIVNADSRQLFRHLDIGTAKIREEEMRGVPHHLLSVLDPKKHATVAWYKREAEGVIREILARKAIPILVGGSMLYISSIVDGLEMPPPAKPALRRALEEEVARDGGEALYAELLEADPETARAFSPKNSVYVIRAMEIYRTTGEVPSIAKSRSPCPFDCFIIGVRRSRSVLHENINTRVEAMFAQGWVDEVRSLFERGYKTEDPGMQSHGYREIMNEIERFCTYGESDIKSLARDRKLRARIIQKTKQYAKRQETWWRGEDRIHWVNL